MELKTLLKLIKDDITHLEGITGDFSNESLPISDEVVLAQVRANALLRELELLHKMATQHENRLETVKKVVKPVVIDTDFDNSEDDLFELFESETAEDEQETLHRISSSPKVKSTESSSGESGQAMWPLIKKLFTSEKIPTPENELLTPSAEVNDVVIHDEDNQQVVELSDDQSQEDEPIEMTIEPEVSLGIKPVIPVENEPVIPEYNEPDVEPEELGEPEPIAIIDPEPELQEPIEPLVESEEVVGPEPVSQIANVEEVEGPVKIQDELIVAVDNEADQVTESVAETVVVQEDEVVIAVAVDERAPISEVQVERQELLSEETKVEKKTLGESLGESQQLVNDFLSPEKNESGFQITPIHSIWDGIGINDRFLFIRELFANSSAKFETTVSTLDKLETIHEAVGYLKLNYKWTKTEASQKFLVLVKRRFTK